MHLQGIISEIEGAIRSASALAGADPAVEAAAGVLLSGLRPALQQAAFSLAEQAALEIAAQLPSHEVEVVLADGEPSLRVVESAGSASPLDEELAARLTLRLPPSVKALIEEAATGSGASVNQWVVDALAKGVRQRGPRGRSETGTIDL